MKQLKLKTTWLKDAEALSDAEMGRLVRGMLKYASSGEVPKLTGNERTMWPKAREEVDGQRGSHERQQAGNIKRHNEASCGITGHDDASRGIEKASPQSSPTPPVITPLKEKKETLSKEREKKKDGTPLDDALEAFKEMRVRMRKPMTKLAVELLVKKLEKFAPGDEEKQVAILHQSIENGWTGVYELKQEWHGRPKSQTFDNYKAEGNACPRLDDIALTLEDEL